PSTPSTSVGRPDSPAATLPPLTNGQNTSATDASKLTVAFCSTRSPSPSPNTSLIHLRQLLTPPWLTITPFGTPVDPDVYITYARFSGCITTSSSPSPLFSSSTTTTSHPSPDSLPSSPRLVTSSLAPASRSISRFLASGYSGSSPRYAPPALSTPSRPTTCSTDLSMHTPPTSSNPSPRSRRRTPRS